MRLRLPEGYWPPKPASNSVRDKGVCVRGRTQGDDGWNFWKAPAEVLLGLRFLPRLLFYLAFHSEKNIIGTYVSGSELSPGKVRKNTQDIDPAFMLKKLVQYNTVINLAWKIFTSLLPSFLRSK